jgi:hypothetical protein
MSSPFRLVRYYYISDEAPGGAFLQRFSARGSAPNGAGCPSPMGGFLIRKGLFIALLAVSLLVIAAGVALGTLAFKPGRMFRPPGSHGYSLSFKPFTPGDLLHFRLKVDVASSGKEVKSAKLYGIETRTSEVRGLPLKDPVKFVALPEVALRHQLLEEFSKESPDEELDADQKLLVALGLFPEDKNLQTVLTDVYTEQIAGAYDTEMKKITIVAGKNTNSATDELTMSHETTHALQDQNFGLDKSPLDNKDYNGLAVTSLIEGDATLTMVLYGRKYMTAGQLQEVGNQEVSTHELDTAPTYIRESVLFPYDAGTTFAQQLYSWGGEQAVDKALTDPPLSTEQILHPRKYFGGRDNPVPVPLEDISASLGKGWKKINDDCLGEFDMEVWFREHTVQATATRVSEGWGGNTIQYYQGPGKEYVVVIDTVWDSEGNAREFFDDYDELLKGRFGSGLKSMGSSQTAYIYQADGQFFYCGINGKATLALQATDRAALEKALANYPKFPPAPKPGV